MRVVIVGGGVGGLACAQSPAKRGGASEVQLIDRTLRHDFAPSFLWLITGQRAPERVSRSLAPLRRARVELTEADPACGCARRRATGTGARIVGGVRVVRRGEVACCGTCLDARGLSESQLVDGARRSTLEELTDWTLWADKVLVF